MNKNRHAGLGLYTIGIAALFLAGFFLLVVFGAQSYRSTVGGQNRNMQSRALLSYLSTTVKGYDAEGAVGIDEDGEVGKVLILREGRSGYALRIYRADGMLVEEGTHHELMEARGEYYTLFTTQARRYIEGGREIDPEEVYHDDYAHDDRLAGSDSSMSNHATHANHLIEMMIWSALQI